MTNAKPFKVYQASAGSGKTYTIIREYLGLCLLNKSATDNYRTILAITFTNKAANEMKAKIIHQLKDIIESDNPKPRTGMIKDLIDDLKINHITLKNNAELLFQKIIHDYSSFCISTIDSFVQKLSKSFAKDLNLPSQYNVSIDQDEFSEDVIDKIGEQIGKDNKYLTIVLNDYLNHNFTEGKGLIIRNYLSKFVTDLLSESSYQKNETKKILDENHYRETQKDIRNRIKNSDDYIKKSVDAYDNILTEHGLNRDDCTSNLNNYIDKLRSGDYKLPSDTNQKIIDKEKPWYLKTKLQGIGQGEIDSVSDALSAALGGLRENIATFFFFKDQQGKLSFYALRAQFQAAIEDIISDEQLVHISEFNKRINQIMGDFSVPFIYERIGERFKHVFIDEFQDTSILQWQNLIPLIDNSLATDSMSMVVGDGKQSIYRFRSGEVEQIMNLPEIYQKPNDPAFNTYENNLKANFNFTSLDNNYRSFSNIVNFNNDFFTKACDGLPDKIRKVYIDNNPTYGKTVSIVENPIHTEEGLVQIELIDKELGGHEVYLDRIIELIGEIMQHGFSYKDITILVRSNANGCEIAKFLNDNGIPVISSESILLRTSNKVQLIVNTLKYLTFSKNTAFIGNVIYYWHAVHDKSFNGNIDGLFDQVHNIAESKTSLELAIGLTDGQFKSLLSKSYSLFDLCLGLARSFGIDTASDPYLNYFMEEIHKWQASDKSGIERFLEYWDDNAEKLSIKTSGADAVSIMSIHKSKGLEFNVVIYPYAITKIGRNNNSNSIWLTPGELGINPIPNIGKIQVSINDNFAELSLQSKAIYEDEMNRLMLDDLNLLYVTFTRAKQRLYILAAKNGDKSAVDSIIERYLADKQGNPISTEDDGNTHIIYRFGNSDSNKVDDHNNEADEIIVSDRQQSPSADWFDKIQVDPDPSMFWMSDDDKMQPREWGIMVHQILSEIHTIDDVDTSLAAYLADGTIDQDTANLLKDKFNQVATHELVKDAYCKDAIVKNECEILSKEFGIIRPDRYAELPDKVYLIDYKTGKKEDGHKTQLQNYAAALRQIINKEIVAYLIYLDGTIDVVPISL